MQLTLIGWDSAKPHAARKIGLGPMVAEAVVTTLRFALIGMALLAALEFYGMMVGGGYAGN